MLYIIDTLYLSEFITVPVDHSRNKKILKKAQHQQQTGKLNNALNLYQQLITIEPNNSDAYYGIANILASTNKLLEAIPCYEKAITLGIRNDTIFAKLADIFVQLSRFHDAMPMAKAAVTLNPDNILALRALVKILFALGQYEDAYQCGNQLIAKSDANAADYILLAEIYVDSSQPIMAITLVEEALKLDPHVKKADQTLCSIYIGTRRLNEAMQIIERNLDKTPNNSIFKCMQAYILERRGEYDKAYAVIKPLITDGKHTNHNVIIYATIAKHFNEQKQAAHLLEALLAKENIPVSVQHLALNYLATHYDELGLYDKAFFAFEKCNAIKPHRYNNQEHDEYLQHIKKWFTKERLKQFPMATEGSKRPIFIVGMPRSGTSLTEKILARHPDVYAGGELYHIKNIAIKKIPGMLNTNKIFPDYLQDLPKNIPNQMASYYLEQVDQLAPNHESYITDKMPMNFTYLGLITLLFPQARIIHCTRNPLATGLSCYMTNFRSVDEMAFSQDLKNIGLYYKRYEQLMEYWHQVLPNPIYDLSYESLVSDPEVEIRKLLEFCQLPWHEGCLTPHESKENTETASYNQIRQPINTRSIERWKLYEEHLQPLKDVLNLT